MLELSGSSHHSDSAGKINNQLSSIRGGPRSISGDVDFLLILAQKKTNPPAKWTANDAGLPVPLVLFMSVNTLDNGEMM